MRCSGCGRDIDEVGQDNCSCIPGSPLCDDCAGLSGVDYYSEKYQEEDSE